MFFLIIITIIFIGYGIIEYWLHLKNVRKIPVRIQVNGTRGKSSVTRLIAGGIRASGKTVIAKTTGTKPRFIVADNEEYPIKRLGKPNIGEEKKIFRYAMKYKPVAIVMECMALVPEYQWTETNRLVKTTHGVITNARADHLDVMGPSVLDVAKALSNTVPPKGKFFTAEHIYTDVFRNRAQKVGAQIFISEPEQVSDAEMKGFTYIEHKENVALALMVCQHLGVDKQTALKGMYRTNPDPGAMRIFTIKEQDKEIRLVNTLAANDPDSIHMLWQRVENIASEKIVLVNCRDDRADRSVQLGELTALKFKADWYVATGFLTMAYIRKATSLGLDKNKIIDLGEKTPAQIYEKVVALVNKDAMVFATGNIVGFGDSVIEYFSGKGGEIKY